MRILVIGAGGVGSAFIPTALRRSFFEHIVVADHDVGRAEAAVVRAADPRVSAARVDAFMEPLLQLREQLLGPLVRPKVREQQAGGTERAEAGQ